MQPQLSLTDYFGGKSIVLRSLPEDFFKSYSQHLINLGGKWNPNLKAPSGVGTLGGWIFPKSKEATVRNGLAQITSGHVQPQATYSSLNQGQVDTLQQAIYGNQQQNSMQQIIARAQAQLQSPVNNVFTQQQTQPINNSVTPQSMNSMQQLLSRAQSQVMLNEEPAADVFSSAVPIGEIPSVPQGYQQIVYVVIKPEVGQTLQLHISGQKIPVMVEKVEINNNVTNSAIIKLPDGQVTKISLTNDQWAIPGYEPTHSITLI